jgi:hypothetical protein
MRILPTATAALAMALLATGCATQSYAPEEAPELSIIRDYAGFYRLGPIQARGPDVSLRTGERVKLMRKEMGYSLVMLEDQRTGYVANEYLAPAPPRPPQPAAPSGPSTSGSSSRRSDRYRGPQVNDSPLPEPSPAPDLDLNIGPEDVVPMPPSPAEPPAEPPAFRY